MTERLRRLTPHQSEVLDRLKRFSRNPHLEHEGWVLAAIIGSGGALNRLRAKGYAEHRQTRGPRGGYHDWYRPTTTTETDT